MVQDIVKGISDFILSLGGSIIDFFASLIATLINIIFLPVNALLNFFVPDLNIIVQKFYDTFTYISSDLISYIFSYIPPNTKFIILTFFFTLISYYTVKYTYKALILIPHLYNKIKFW